MWLIQKLSLPLLLLVMCQSSVVHAQDNSSVSAATAPQQESLPLQMAMKTNLLNDLLSTPNIGLEMSVGKHSTAQLFYGLNPWSKWYGSADRSVKHWVLQPEYRYWLCQPFNGWFFGVHLMGGEFNVSDVEMPLDLLPDFQKGKREEGWFVGGGVTAGYQWMLSRHWNAEASLGLGYDYINYDRYKCGHCGEKEKSSHTNYLGPTKLALSLLYVF